ncbi:MAG TPA: hypothetical protein VMU55_08850 [Solirubrobacteraceae bacterium]|nr:hypothetical protein [Solirubrobacteraceae bacterium]
MALASQCLRLCFFLGALLCVLSQCRGGIAQGVVEELLDSRDLRDVLQQNR